MIELERAIDSAMKFAKAYLTVDPKDLALEEVEADEDDKVWLITLGYAMPPGRYSERGSAVDWVRGFEPRFMEHPREYKRFSVDGESGQVKAMSFVKI